MNDYNGRNGNGYQPLPTPPTTEYAGGRVCKGDVRLGGGCGACSRCFAQVKELSLLPSERKELTNKIIHLEQEKELIYASTLRKITRIINTADFMTDEVKNELLKLIWEK